MARIMIIDDERGFRRALKLALCASGHEVTEAASGPEALTILRAAIPELILLDWRMPGLDGLQICRVIRSEFDVPVIVVTSRDSSGRNRALAAGASDYVSKPFGLDQLLSRVNSVLSR
ncbi:MAG TPA: response regulator [Verrucomicrobiae bacterium]|nr:response regulator [Verrucomicrobiae bacterium]